MISLSKKGLLFEAAFGAGFSGPKNIFIHPQLFFLQNILSFLQTISNGSPYNSIKIMNV